MKSPGTKRGYPRVCEVRSAEAHPDGHSGLLDAQNNLHGLVIAGNLCRMPSCEV